MDSFPRREGLLRHGRVGRAGTEAAPDYQSGPRSHGPIARLRRRERQRDLRRSDASERRRAESPWKELPAQKLFPASLEANAPALSPLQTASGSARFSRRAGRVFGWIEAVHGAGFSRSSSLVQSRLVWPGTTPHPGARSLPPEGKQFHRRRQENPSGYPVPVHWSNHSLLRSSGARTGHRTFGFSLLSSDPSLALRQSIRARGSPGY